MDRIVFEITDNGAGIEEEVLERLKAELQGEVELHSENIGLRNVNDRIRILYGDRFGLDISSSTANTTVKISFPVIEGE